jgi:hypothetical protein
MSTVPRWYLPVTIAALLWNLLGCFAYLSDVMVTPEAVARMSADQQALYAARSWWAVSATAIAVWGGAAGCVGLILRKSWALPLLVASLAGVIVQDLGLLLLTDARAHFGGAALMLQGLVLLVAIGLVVLARGGSARGSIPYRAVPQA